MNISKELSLLGLAAKAGRVVSGEFATEKAVKAGKARLVLVAGDASDYKVPIYLVGTKEELGGAIGKDYRASLGVTDDNFAVAMKKKLEQMGK